MAVELKSGLGKSVVDIQDTFDLSPQELRGRGSTERARAR